MGKSARVATADLPEGVARLHAAPEGAYLAAHHAEAARRLGRLFQQAHLRQRLTMSYDPARISSRPNGGQADITDAAAEARRRLTRLAGGLPGECWGVLVDVCLYEKGLQLVEQERGWPRRSAKLVLRIGLDHLARGWGLMETAAGRDGARQRGWLPERPPMFADSAD